MQSFLKKYVLKFYYAFAGLFHGLCHDSSILLQCLIGLVVIIVSCFFHLALWEWIIIFMLVAMVIALEFVNSALETVVDKICPDYDLDAKKIKDYAAAAVLVMSIAAAIIAVLIFGGKLWS